MLSSLVKQTPAAGYSDLVGAQVLLTGVRSGVGSALALAFARARARLIIQAAGPSSAAALIGELGGPGECAEIDPRPFRTAAAAARFAQHAARSFGGLDAVVNIIALSALNRDRAIGGGDAEEAVHDLLLPASLITRVAGNRMRVMRREGSVLNILVLPFAAKRADAAFARLSRAAFAAMTRLEAQEFASSGVRVNAICPQVLGDRDLTAAAASDEDIAALALYLASRKGRRISGHVLDAGGIAKRRC